MRLLLLTVSVLAILAALTSVASADWKPYAIQQLNGGAERIKLRAQYQIPTGDSSTNVGLPYMAYIPEKDKLVMTITFNGKAALLESFTRGATWSQPRYTPTDGTTWVWLVGLSYLGGGVCVAGSEPMPNRIISRDYGVTWEEFAPVFPSIPGAPMYYWDPVFADRDPKTGKPTRLTLARYRQEDPNQLYSSQSYIFFSSDEGKTWSEPRKVPEWNNVNEVCLIRAKNGNLIAACRTDNPDRFKSGQDGYCGLAVSISKDNGLTWSKLNHLYEYGRHHPSMVVLKDGAIVMSYVVRIGYTNALDGSARYGIEAVVSQDNGKTWDLDHRYILASWKGGSPQCTSSVVLPGDVVLTAFSLGDQPGHPGRAVDVVRWKVNSKGLNKDHAIADAPWDSEGRNQFDCGELTFDK